MTWDESVPYTQLKVRDGFDDTSFEALPSVWYCSDPHPWFDDLISETRRFEWKKETIAASFRKSGVTNDTWG